MEIQGYLIQGIVNGSYSCMIGIDRVEEYVTQEQKYVPSNTHYTSGGIDFYEKEGARHLVDVTKTRTVTDWQIHNGEIINEHHSAVKTELGYEDFESSFWKLFRRDDLDKIHDESIDNEKLPNGFYDKGIDLLRNDVVNGISWPGDHHKDENFNISIDNYKIYRCIVPTYQVSCVYKGQVCLVQGFAIDQIYPVIEKRVSGSSNSVESLKQQESTKISKTKKISLSSGIIAILAVISGFIGFVSSPYEGGPWPWYIGFFVGIAASIAIAVFVALKVSHIKKEYEDKILKLSCMKYILLKLELDKRGFPELTDEEKDALQSSMGVDSFDNIDEVLIFEAFDIKKTDAISSESIKTKTTSRENKRKLTKKQKSVIGILSTVVGVGVIVCVCLIIVLTSNPLKFSENADGTYTLTHCDRNVNEVQILATYRGRPITKIHENAFSYCSNLTSIEIPEGITYIGYAAFMQCNNLTSIKLPSTLITIDAYAFAYCDNLKNIEIPHNVTSIGGSAFSGCVSLESIEFPAEVTYIGFEALRGCDNLESITIPFVGEKVNSTANTHFGYIFGNYSYNNLDFPSNLEEVIITDGTTIDEHAFSSIDSLISVVIPNSVTEIGSYAFWGCENLVIYCEAERQPSAWDSKWNDLDRPVVWGYKETN